MVRSQERQRIIAQGFGPARGVWFRDLARRSQARLDACKAQRNAASLPGRLHQQGRASGFVPPSEVARAIREAANGKATGDLRRAHLAQGPRYLVAHVLDCPG